MSSYVTIAFGLGPTPQFLSCASGGAGAQLVVQFSPGQPVPQGAIIVPPGATLPGAPFTQWNPPVGYWVVMASGNLPATLPAWGSSTDLLHFALPPAAAPGE